MKNSIQVINPSTERPAKEGRLVLNAKTGILLILVTAGSALLTSLLILLVMEAVLRVKRLETDSGPVLKKYLVQHPLYGWDSIPSLERLNNAGSKRVVYFVGDSFLQGAAWPRLAQEHLKERGLPIDGYNLGVSGFGTVQEYLKIQNTYNLHRPQIVVLLFFAWNDLRDNFYRPAIYYNSDTRHRPYLSQDNSPRVFWPSRPSTLEKLEIYKTYFFRNEERFVKVFVKLFGLDFLMHSRLPIKMEYEYSGSWKVFYKPPLPTVKYRESAWRATEQAFAAMKDFLDRQGATLIVLGIDNAFTVDKDVRETHLYKGGPFDTREPLRRLQELLDRHGIFYVDCVPLLHNRSNQLGRKIYSDPPGNLSGHFTPASQAVIARAAATAMEAKWRSH